MGISSITCGDGRLNGADAAERMPVRDWEKLAAKGRKLFYGRGFLPVAFVVQ